MTADKKGKGIRPRSVPLRRRMQPPTEVKLCRDCKYLLNTKAQQLGLDTRVALCRSKSAPITQFVHGQKEAHKINTDGCCAHYQVKA